MKILKFKDENTDINYIKFGNGKKNLVIIPGLSIKNVTYSANSIKNQYKKLTNDYTIFVIDRNSVITEGYTLDDAANDTIKIIEYENIYDFDLMGVSQGGMIAQIIALNRSENVNKLILVSTSDKISNDSRKILYNWKTLADNKNVTELVNDFINRLFSDEFYNKYINVIMPFYDDITDDELQKFSIMCSAGDNFNIEAQLHKIKAKTYVIGAENDKVLGVTGSKNIAKILNCNICLYKSPYGHGFYDEAKDFTDKLYDALIKETR